jgi:hypothetical protein
MADINISKFTTQVLRVGSTPSSPGFAVDEGQDPVDPSGNPQTHLPVTIAPVSTGLSITDSQVLAGAGTVAQYIRGDGSLADFPATTGGGASVSYYLNGSVSQGTIGGVAYREFNRNPVFGAGTDITRNSDGYIASFITDAGDPNKLLIPAGNWNLETYFSASSGGGSPTFYVELYKYDGTTFTLIASSATSPELIAFGTNLNPYFSTLAVPQTTLALTDRLALRYYVNTSGRTITLHTENDHLCQVITTFTTGLTALNGLTTQVQFFAVGTSGSDFNIASATDTHTFNLPTASATNRGALSSADWALFTQAYNDKINSASVTGTTTKTLTLTQQDGGTITASWTDLNTDAVLSVFGRTGAVVAANGDYTTAQVTESGNLYYTEARVNANTNVAANTAARHNAVTLGTANGLSLSTQVLSLGLASAGVTGALSGTDWSTFNSKQNALTNPVTGTGTSGQVAYFTGTTTISSESNLFWDATNNRLGIGTNNPSSQLLVVGDSGQLTGNYRYHAQFVQDQTTARGIGLGFKSDEQLGIIFGESSGSASSIGFITYSGSAWNERMRITSAGNLGIGASIPSGQLHLKGSSGLTNFGTQMLQVESSTDNFSGIVFSGTNGSNAAIRSEGASTMTFWTGSGTSYTKQITIISTGNVGIGTGSPNTGKLVVKSGESNSTGIVLERGDNTDKLVNIFSETADGKISISSGANTRVFLDSVGSSYFTGGNVLIGTNTDAGFKVLVNSGNITNGGSSKPALAVRSGGTTYLDFYQGWNSSIAGQSILGTTLVSSDDLAFASAGTERLRIDLNGASIFRGSVATPHTTKSANYTLTATDFTVGFDCASNRTANLPDATTCAGRIYVIYQYNTNNGARSVTLDGSGSQTIDGVTTYSLAFLEDFSSVMIQSNGSNWIVIAVKFYPPVT